MSDYEFTAILAGVSTLAELSDETIDRLYESGCDDGTLGSTEGKVFVHFTRQADSLQQAIESAIADIRSAGFEVARVETEETVTINKINARLLSPV
jgi:hypothetical protein